MKRLVLALLIVSVLPFSAAAKDAFKNLPGVKDPATEEERQLDTVCTSRLERQHATRYRNGLAYRTYSCRYGRATVGSNRPPNLIEYRKYKQRY
ncbi:MAG: hypothetical protein KL863_16610 [Rhizobium sp.]|nr:hypothetical protein [Rhizobium sp.]